MLEGTKTTTEDNKNEVDHGVSAGSNTSTDDHLHTTSHPNASQVASTTTHLTSHVFSESSVTLPTTAAMHPIALEVQETTTPVPITSTIPPKDETTTVHVSNETTTSIHTTTEAPHGGCECSFQVGAFIGGLVMGAIIGLLGSYFIHYLTHRSASFAQS
jgi:hypothetical protein